MTNEEFIKQNSKLFSHEYSQFPENLITLHHFKDADDSIASLLNEINDLKSRGLFDLAAKKIDENADILAPYTFSAEHINIYEEEILNTQIMAKLKHQCVYAQSEKPLCCIGDIWIKLKEGD